MSSTVAPIKRNIKNVIKNYSEAQVKVREATSNDPWGPSSSIMREISDLTYNVVAFSEIMQMIWKRLNDHGKNWRHVYKALSLLEYILKTGNEKVAQQCKENIFAIQTLKDFQYYEENKDQGLNVREKAKQIVALLKDDERLKNERTRALKAKERFLQSHSTTSMHNTKEIVTPQHSTSNDEWDTIQPLTPGEEEIQLQVALALSKEEAENEKKLVKSDDLRLQLALSQSEQEIKSSNTEPDMLIDIDMEESKDGKTNVNDFDPWSASCSKDYEGKPELPQKEDPKNGLSEDIFKNIMDNYNNVNNSSRYLAPAPPNIPTNMMNTMITTQPQQPARTHSSLNPFL